MDDAPRDGKNGQHGRLEVGNFLVIDPRISFGRPVIAGTNIRTSIVAERYLAGESINALARDYGRDHGEIEEAIRCEIPTAA